MKNKISNFFKFFLKDNRKLSLFLLLILIFPSVTFGLEFFSAEDLGGLVLSFLSLIAGLLQWIGIQILQMAAYLFDNFLFITLSTNLYDADWIKVGWAIFRDLANIAFILGIIVIGIYMIIGKQEGSDGWERMLLNLIIAALAMNFSMFVGRIIIDMGNFTASVFYRISTIEVKNNTKDGANKDVSQSFKLAEKLLGLEEGEEPYYGKRAYATALVSYINPYYMKDPAIMKTAIKNQYQSNPGGKFEIDQGNKTKKVDMSNSNDKSGSNLLKWILLFNSFLSAWIFFIISKTFFVTSITFIVRAGYLIYSLIKAPIYFAWSFLPNGDKAFKEWFTDIVTKSFCITVFTAGLWILMMFVVSVQKELFTDPTGNDSLIMIYLLVMGKAFLVIVVVKILGQKTTELCEGGKAGSMSWGERVWSLGASTIGKVAGVTGAMAFGGAGLLARGYTRGSRFIQENRKPNYDGPKPKRGEWAIDKKNPLYGEEGWGVRAPQNNQPIEAILSKESVDELHKDEKADEKEKKHAPFNVSKYNTGYVDQQNKIKKDDDKDIDKIIQASASAMDNVGKNRGQTSWEDSKSAIPLAANRKKPSMDEFANNVLAKQKTNISSAAAKAITTPAQTSMDMSNSVMKFLRSNTSSSNSEKKSGSSASEIITKKQDTGMVINTSGATINSKQLNIDHDKEKTEASKAAQNAVQDAKIKSVVNESASKWNTNKAGEVVRKKAQWEKENEGKGVFKALKNLTVNGVKKGINNTVDIVKNKKAETTWKAAKGLAKGIAATTIVPGAKIAEKAWIQLDKHGTSEHAKVGDERRKKNADAMKDWGKRQDEAAKKLSSAEDKLETARVELEVANSEKERKIALNKKKLAEKEFKAAEKAVKKAATKTGKTIAEEIKDAFTTELWKGIKTRNKVNEQQATLKDIGATMKKVNKQSEEVVKKLKEDE